MSDYDIAKDIRDTHSGAIMGLPDVVGSGIGTDGYGDPVICIYLRNTDPLASYADLIWHIEGVPVRWELTGEITAAAFGDGDEKE